MRFDDCFPDCVNVDVRALRYTYYPGEKFAGHTRGIPEHGKRSWKARHWYGRIVRQLETRSRWMKGRCYVCMYVSEAKSNAVTCHSHLGNAVMPRGQFASYDSAGTAGAWPASRWKGQPSIAVTMSRMRARDKRWTDWETNRGWWHRDVTVTKIGKVW